MQVPNAQSTSVATVLLLLVPPLKKRQGIAAAIDLVALQTRLGPKIQVLLVDKETYPAIVRSFAPARLPSRVLLHKRSWYWAFRNSADRRHVLPPGKPVAPSYRPWSKANCSRAAMLGSSSLCMMLRR